MAPFLSLFFYQTENEYNSFCTIIKGKEKNDKIFVCIDIAYVFFRDSAAHLKTNNCVRSNNLAPPQTIKRWVPNKYRTVTNEASKSGVNEHKIFYMVRQIILCAVSLPLKKNKNKTLWFNRVYMSFYLLLITVCKRIYI